MCWAILCVQKKFFQPLGGSDYQSPQCKSTCQVHNILFEEQRNLFFSKFRQRIYIFEEMLKSIHGVVGESHVCCPTRSNKPRELADSMTVKSRKPAVTCFFSIYGTKANKNFLWWRLHGKKDEHWLQEGKPSLFLKTNSLPIAVSHTWTSVKRGKKNLPFMACSFQNPNGWYS